MTGPTPHSVSTGSGCRKLSSPSGGTTSRPSGLATPLAHLGQELGARHPDGDRQADPLEHLRAQSGGDLGRCAGDPPQAADVEERLVDRQPSTSGVVSSNTSNTAWLASV